MLRCPYCHDAIDAEAPTCVVCDACGATQHAECFVEISSCAGTACQHDAVRLGGAVVTPDVLSALLQEPDRLAAVRGAAPTTRPSPVRILGGLGTAVGLTLLVAGVLRGPDPTLLWVGASLTVVGILLAFTSSLEAPEVRLRHPGDRPLDFDPIFGTWTKDFMPGIPADPTGAFRQALKDGAEEQPPAPEGEPPLECPDCARPLEAEDEPDLFCYHCGASRVARDGTRWRLPGEPLEADEPGEKAGPPKRLQE